MHIAAIHNPQDNKDELANALAAALGATLYEARSRLRGTCIALRSETRLVKERKFSIGRAVLSRGH